jgi:serine/threonine protein kinase
VESLVKFGDFEARKKIGAGGMGTVWEVEHPRRSEPFAAKVAMHARATLPEYRQRFEREVRAMARLRHPNVVRVFDYGVYFGGPAPDAPRNGTPWVVMEYAPGGELEPESIDSWERLRAVLRGLLAGLAHSHSRGLIHRDIKPQNILWVERRGERVPAVADFGIAHALDRQRPSSVDHFTARNAEEATGTPRYMAPEQFMGLWRDYGPGTDLYAAGILAFVLASGDAPYHGQNLYQYAAKHMHDPFPALEATFDVPDHFEGWVRWLTEKAIEDRPHSARAALDALDALERVTFPGNWRTVEPDDEPGRAPVGVGLFGLNRTFLVGREKLRTALWSALETASSGQAVGVNLHGGQGVGKSRLARWLSELALERDLVAKVYDAHFSSERPDTAGLSWMLAQRLRCAGMDSEKLEERLATVLPDEWDDEARTATLQAVSQAESVASDTTSPTVKSSMMVEVARRLIAHDARERPVIVHLDDADFDPTGQAKGLAEALLANDLPVVVVSTSQGPWEHGTPHEVGPLPDIDFKRLLRDELGLPIAVSEKVEQLADGNPRFAMQLLEHWLDGGHLAAGNDGALRLETDDLPTTLDRLWEARIAAFSMSIDDDAMPVLLAGGVLGSPIEPEEWLATAAELGVDLDSPLFGDVARAIVESGLGAWDASDRMRLVHRTVAPLLAGAAGDSARARAHGAAARALTSLYSANEHGLALRVAHHFREAGNARLALVALEPALESAMEVVDSGELGEVAQAMLDALDALGVPEGAAQRARARTYRAIEWVTSAREDDRDRAGEWLDRAFEATRNAAPDVAAQVEAARAWASIKRGGREEAAEALERLVEDDTIKPWTRSLARMFVTHLYTYLHDAEGVRRHAVATLGGDVPPAWKLRAREALIHVALAARDAEAAKQHAFPALILAKQLKRLHLEVHIENLSGFIADLDGDFAAAESHHARAERLAGIVHPHAGVRLMAREYRARALVHQDEFAEAFELLWSLADEVEAGRAPATHPWDALFAASVALGRADGESRSRDRLFPPLCNALHVRSVAKALSALERAGRVDDAEALRTEALEVFGEAAGVTDDDLEVLA